MGSPILKHFLSACETLKLLSMLEQTQQKLCVIISTYICCSEQRLKEHIARRATEETWVVSRTTQLFALLC